MAVADYKAPSTVSEAVSLLASAQMKAKVMAGGTDLIIQSKSQTAEPLLVVDLKRIETMKDYQLTDEGLSLGPAMCCAEFTALEDVKAVYPGLTEAAYLIGSTQVQGRASVGGNLCNSSPAADTIPALIANGAQCVIEGPDGDRTVPVEDFVTGVGKNCLAANEILKRIVIPRPAPGTADAYLRFIPRTEMDIAVAGAGVSVTLDADGTCTAARVGIGAVAPTAMLVPAAAAALVGTKLDDTALEAAAKAASEASNPITDRRGTVEFRRHVVGVLVKRAAKIAQSRAQG
ncbi:MAG: xanthine dehydrogenase family protein subunit M [Pseudomonadales bacterium]|nr:xanthine dehydrogenase family protein subunit M [Pseudomonadales bacterium]